MSKKQNKKKKSVFMKIVSIFLDILIVPIIVLAFICTIITFSAKANNKVPQIFGKSIVTVLSDSMEPEYMVGDVLIIKKVDVESLKIGDNIAFYAPVWLSWPFTSVVNGERVSNIIYHQIVDIIYPKNEQGERVRHFVCRGTNTHEPGYVYVGTGGERANYKKTEDGKYVMSPGTGDYAIVLEDLVNKDYEDLTTEDIKNSPMPTMQYITDEYVVGVYDSSLSPAIGGFIKFASSTVGLTVMVIVPAALMIIYVAFSMFKDAKASKEEEEEDDLVLEGNISMLKETSAIAKAEAEKEANVDKKSAKENKKVEEVDLASVISGAMASRSSANQGSTTETISAGENKPTANESETAKVETKPQTKTEETKKTVAKPVATKQPTTKLETVKDKTPETNNTGVVKDVKSAKNPTAKAVPTAVKTAPKTQKETKPLAKASTEITTAPKAEPTVKVAPKTAPAVKTAPKVSAPKDALASPEVKKVPEVKNVSESKTVAKPTTVKKAPPKKD